MPDVSKRWLATHHPLGSIARVFAIGAVGIAFYGLDETLVVPWTSLTPGWWAWAAFIVLFATIGAYFLNYWALRRETSSLVALFIYLQPVVATALDGLLRGEWPGARFPVAAVLVLTGVAVGAIASPGGRRPAAGGR